MFRPKPHAKNYKKNIIRDTQICEFGKIYVLLTNIFQHLISLFAKKKN